MDSPLRIEWTKASSVRADFATNLESNSVVTGGGEIVRGKFGTGERGKSADVSHIRHGAERSAGGAKSQIEISGIARFAQALEIKTGEFAVCAEIFGVAFDALFKKADGLFRRFVVRGKRRGGR